MKIMGLQKTTLLDYPGLVGTTIFLAGCNMRCPFCHNTNLIDNNTSSPEYSMEEVINFLKKRQGIIEGVCITGGEPTLNPDLHDFIQSIRSLGYKIKLDTNGSNPSVLKSLINEDLLDYVAMDIKSSLEAYPLLCGLSSFDTSSIVKAIDILNSSSIDHEYRTTVIKQYHTKEIMGDIGKLLKGSNKYYLQSFKDSDFVPDHSLSPCSKEELLSFLPILKEYVELVELRGID